MKFLFLALSGVLSFVTNINQIIMESQRSFTPLDLVTMERTGGMKVSPCKSNLIFVRTQYDANNNQKTQNLWSFDLVEKSLSQLTHFDSGIKISEFVWMDCSNVLFLYLGKDGGSFSEMKQINVDSLTTTTVKKLDFDISNLFYDHENGLLFFTSEVYFGKSILETLEMDNLKSKEFSTGMVFDKLYFRHWDTYDNHKYSHIFMIQLNNEMSSFDFSLANDLMKDSRFSCPIQPFGDITDFTINPATRKLAFSTMQDYDKTIQSYSTNTNIYLTDVLNPRERVCITCNNLGADTKPLFSKNGEKLAFLEMKTPKFEADKNRLMIYDVRTGIVIDATEKVDLSVGEFEWIDNDTIIFLAGEKGRMNIFKLSVSTMNINRISYGGSATGVIALSESQFLFSRNSMASPNELFLFDLTTGLETQLTYMHSAYLSKISMAKAEEFEFVGAKGESVHGWFLKPYNFQPTKKYPLAFLIHGGPQSAWMDSFSTRWNPQVFSGAGYAVAMINFHGSTTYGQNFTNSISKNWGTYPYEDLMKGLDYILDKNAFIDPKRVAALGASYGGFMINWINGHTDRFAVLVNHDGCFDMRSKYYTTEELYFPEFEFGATPFENPEAFEKFNPAAFVNNWKTPTLVIHGAKDYRVTDGQGFGTFTALQRKGIESKLLFFPDENHWVLKQANSLKWHNVILDWIKKFTKND
jgi:dipeptidyl aminopeptidase/acylaminoacyl peptidase